MRALAVAGLGCALVLACGGGEPARPTPAHPRTPGPPAMAPTPGPEGRIVYLGAPYVIARLAALNALDRGLLAPAGEATTPDGAAVAVSTCPPGPPPGCDAAEWELVAEGDTAWQLWEPVAVAAARQDLAAALALPQAEVTVLDVEPVDWPDACLGAARPGELCAEVITPGFRVSLEARHAAYTYHTDLTGERFRRLEAPPEPAPGTPAAGPKLNPEAAAAAAAEALARRLGVSRDAVTVVALMERAWPDACLGLASPGELCAEVITPGFQVTLAVQEQRYVYRANGDGTTLRAEE